MSSQAAFALLLAVVGLVRLGELVVSARRLRGRPDGCVAEPGLWPLMVLLHTASVFGPVAEVVALDRPFSPALAAGAALVLVAATALRVWTLRTIGRSWNVRVVMPEEGAVATSGPYAWIRHPNYLVVVLELAALPLLHGAWVSSLGLTVLNGLVLARRIRTEEATLGASPAWSAAMAGKARLVPGLL